MPTRFWDSDKITNSTAVLQHLSLVIQEVDENHSGGGTKPCHRPKMLEALMREYCHFAPCAAAAGKLRFEDQKALVDKSDQIGEGPNEPAKQGIESGRRDYASDLA